jgi:hypothetical protein
LETQQRVGEQVGEVEFGALLADERMFAHQQPAHVREEEATIDVVWIGVGVRPFVMATMVAGPLDHVILNQIQDLKQKATQNEQFWLEFPRIPLLLA